MGRARLADQYERRAGRQRRRRCRGRHFLSGLQLDRERQEQRDERLDHLGNEVNLKLPAILASFSLTLGAPGVAAQWSVSAELGVARFGGTSRDSAGATVGPYRPTTFELRLERGAGRARVAVGVLHANTRLGAEGQGVAVVRSEEHTSELQSRLHLVCRLLLEKKKKNTNPISYMPTVHNSCKPLHPA